MVFPPTLLRIRSRRPGRRPRGLWLPIVLLWPLLLVAAILIPLVLAIRALLRWRWRDVPGALLSGPRTALLFCRLRRLRIEFREEDREFLLAVV